MKQMKFSVININYHKVEVKIPCSERARIFSIKIGEESKLEFFITMGDYPDDKKDYCLHLIKVFHQEEIPNLFTVVPIQDGVKCIWFYKKEKINVGNYYGIYFGVNGRLLLLPEVPTMQGAYVTSDINEIELLKKIISDFDGKLTLEEVLNLAKDVPKNLEKNANSIHSLDTAMEQGTISQYVYDEQLFYLTYGRKRPEWKK
jgi:hypothetical protein